MRRNKNTRKLNKTHCMVAAVIALVIVTCVLFLLYIFNRKSVVIKTNGDATIYVEYGSRYNEQGASAVLHNSTLFLLDQKMDVSKSGEVDDYKLGSYCIEYSAEYNGDVRTCERNVIVQDTTPPDIQLITKEGAYTPYNHPYTEEGYTAYDLRDGDVTANVKSEEKDGTVYYSVSDSSGNIGTASRKIIYDDRTGPLITLIGGENISIRRGDTYKDNFTAIDDSDDDVTANVKITGTVDSNTIGSYSLDYFVADSHGNQSTAHRTVNVVEGESNKTIYLTFDDGPGPYTAQLLDVLDKYGVKATFFTTSTKQAYSNMIAQEAARGHTVAVHTYSHNYSQIYSSTAAYWSDFDAQNSVVMQQTGTSSTMFRFPGGSSNTVSENYSKGIMTALASQAAAKGYTYFDWNVSSGDAGGTADTATVVQNVINQVSANSNYGIPSVVLQHDVKEFSVNGVESIIQWGMANGYTFSALNPNSYHAHQRIAN